MSNLIEFNGTTGQYWYTHLRQAGQPWNGSGFEAYNVGHWTNYDVLLAEQQNSGYYNVACPVTGASLYSPIVLNVTAYQATISGSPAPGDAVIGQQIVSWNGTNIVQLTGDPFALLGQPLTGTVAGDINAHLPARIVKNAAFNNFQFLMTNATTGLPATGLTVSAQRCLDAGGFASCANAPVEIGNGWYYINLAATDTNGNNIAIIFSASGASTLNVGFITNT